MLFFENACPTCDTGGELAASIYEMAGVKELRGEFRIIEHNIYYASHREYFKKVLEAVGYDGSQYMTRCVIAGGQAIPYDEWDDKLAGAIKAEIDSPTGYPSFLSSAGDGASSFPTAHAPSAVIQPVKNSRDTLYYFYLPNCADCVHAKNALDSFAGEFPECRIAPIDVSKGDGIETLINYTQAFGVPEDQTSVPIVFFSGGYLPNRQITLEKLRAARGRINADFNVQSGSGVILPESVLVVFANGVLGGLNPCGISMLLLLLSALAAGGSAKAWRIGLFYLAGKSASYILLGTVFYRLLSYLDNSVFASISAIVNWVLAAVSLMLALLYFMDFLSAKKEDYGSIKTQLPVRLRSFNHMLIEGIASKAGSPFFYVSLFLLGAVVAAGDFLCTGQIYLATILYVMKHDGGNLNAAIYFVIYVFSALLIPVGIIAAVKMGATTLNISEAARRKLPLIKLIYALLFLVIAISVIWITIRQSAF